MVSFRPLRIGLWDPFQMAEIHGEYKRGDPNLSLQVLGAHPPNFQDIVVLKNLTIKGKLSFDDSPGPKGEKPWFPRCLFFFFLIFVCL